MIDYMKVNGYNTVLFTGNAYNREFSVTQILTDILLLEQLEEIVKRPSSYELLNYYDQSSTRGLVRISGYSGKITSTTVTLIKL